MIAISKMSHISAFEAKLVKAGFGLIIILRMRKSLFLLWLIS